MFVSSKSFHDEETRIRNAYARRRNTDIYSYFNQGQLFMMQERERRFIRLLERYKYNPLENKKILEIGCGSGGLLRDLIRWGARPENITGIDLLPESVSQALHLCPSGTQIQQGNVVSLDFSNGHFDLVVQSTVFTSVLDDNVKRQMASEMCRVLKVDGLILWFDYHINNPRNPDVKGVKAHEIRRLFPGYHVHLESITLAPPIVRSLARYSWLLCYWLSMIPCFCTHYVGVIRKI